MTYWFMRMKQGVGGEDYTAEMWESGRVGVLFGPWRIFHVMDGNGAIDRAKLKASAILNVCPQSHDLPFDDEFLAPARKFLIGVQAGDRIVVAFNGAIHIGVASDEFLDDPLPRGKRGGHFKCRRIYNAKAFDLSELPSIYRLVTGIGRGTIQEIDSLRTAIELLDGSGSSADLRDTLRTMTPQRFLEMLSPEQWEVVCGEYLRDEIGFRFLLLQSGKTLKDVDLVGVDRAHCRVIAQCKNDAKAWTGARVEAWLEQTPVGEHDRVYFFSRGGVRGAVSDRCVIVDGTHIADWLGRSPEYFRCLKEL